MLGFVTRALGRFAARIAARFGGASADVPRPVEVTRSARVPVGVTPRPSRADLEGRERRLLEEIACVERTLRVCRGFPPAKSRLFVARLTARQRALERDLARVVDQLRHAGDDVMAA